MVHVSRNLKVARFLYHPGSGYGRMIAAVHEFQTRKSGQLVSVDVFSGIVRVSVVGPGGIGSYRSHKSAEGF